MALSSYAIQTLLLCGVVVFGLPSGYQIFPYAMVAPQPYAIAGHQLYTSAMMAPSSQSLVRVPKAVGEGGVPTYKDTAPIMPHAMEYVDLKAYESNVRELLAEVDKKDRAPIARAPDAEIKAERARQVASVNIDANPVDNVNSQPARMVQVGGVMAYDNGQSLTSSNTVITKPYKPTSIDIGIPGIFNLQIYRTPDGQRRIGVEVSPGWTNVQVSHDLRDNEEPKYVEVNVEPPTYHAHHY